MRLSKLLALLLVVGFAGSAFAITYNAGTETLTYDPGDYSAVVDPQSEQLDSPPYEYGNISRNGFNALGPRVVAFNEATEPFGPWIKKVVCNYASSVTFDNFHGTEGGGQRWGYGGWQGFLSGFSGGDAWDFVFNGGGGAAPNGLQWFGSDVTCSDPDAIVTGFAICSCGQKPGSSHTQAGTVTVYLTEGNPDSFRYESFGGQEDHLGVCLAYVVPTDGVGITRIEIFCDGGGGSCQYTGLDDLAFIVTTLQPDLIPEPSGLLLLAGGLAGLVRRKRS